MVKDTTIAAGLGIAAVAAIGIGAYLVYGQPPPGQPTLTASPSSTSPGVPVVFTVTGGMFASFAWNFGDGSTTTTTVATITHTYGIAGTFTATVTATTSAGVQTVLSTVISVAGVGGLCGNFDSSWYLNTLPPSTIALAANSGSCVGFPAGAGVLQTRESNPNATDYFNSYYDTGQKGSFPWGTPPSGGLASGIKFISVSLKFIQRSLLAGSRYHIYLGLYYYLPNGPVSALGRNYQWIDTQFRWAENINGIDSPIGTTDTYDPGDSFGYDRIIAQIQPGQTITTNNFNVDQHFQDAANAWGIPPTTPHTLAGLEVGTEGFAFNYCDVDWFTFTSI